MISHVVLMKPRGDLADAERDALIAAFTRATRDIPTIRRVSVGRRVRHRVGYEGSAPDATDYVVVIDFDRVDVATAPRRDAAARSLNDVDAWQRKALRVEPAVRLQRRRRAGGFRTLRQKDDSPAAIGGDARQARNATRLDLVQSLPEIFNR